MDLHKLAAALTFDTPYSTVTDEQRRKAKAINYTAAYTTGFSLHVTGEQLERVLSRYEIEQWLQEVGLPHADTEPKAALAGRLAASICRGFA